MAKSEQYTGNIELIDGLTPANNNDFPLMDAHYVMTEDGTRLDDKLESMGNGGGEKGDDGISATHSWNGTVLTVTSASGTSSADLKGETGEDGISPTIDISKSNGVTTLTITDINGTKTVEILDGTGGGTTPQETITASLSVSPSSKEIGDTVTNARLTWSVSKEADTITLTLPTGDTVDLTNTVSPYIDENEYKVTSVKTWGLTATEKGGGKTVSATASLSYYYRVYWGLGTVETPADGNFITSLSNTSGATTKGRTLTLKPQNQYVYYAVPKALCTTKPIFKIGEGGFPGGFEDPIEITVTNTYGEPIEYYLYRSTELLETDEPINIYIT